MREDTNFKGSDLSCPSIYYLFYAYKFKNNALKISSVRDSLLLCKESIYLFKDICNKRQVDRRQAIGHVVPYKACLPLAAHSAKATDHEEK